MQDEILKHTKKAVAVMSNSEISFGHKVKEVLLEIGIIVFAVSLSIWLHGWSEHRHQQAEVMEFLTDIKNDLKQDVERLKEAKKKLVKNIKDYQFIYSLTEAKVDSLEKAGEVGISFHSDISLTQFSTADYEGFKSSGKIGQIENKIIKKQVLNYYQDLTTGINGFEKIRAEYFLKIMNSIEEDLEKDDKFLFKDSFKRSVKRHIGTSEDLVKFYDTAIGEANSMLKNIDNVEK